MAKKVEKFGVEANVADSSMLLDKLLHTEEDLMKPNVIIHFHDNDTVYEKLVIGNSITNCDSLLSQFLKKVFSFTKKFPDNVFFDITLRGAACLQDVLVDLVRANQSTDILPTMVKNDFSCWTDPFAPNTFSITLEKDCYVKPMLEVMLKSSYSLKNQLELDVSRFPCVYYIDIVKLDDCSPEVSDAVRWIIADVPCGKDAGIGNKFIKFLQQDPVQLEINGRMRKEPLIAGVKGFLLKDTSSTVIFNASYNDCLREFNKTRDVISKWFVLPQGIAKLDTEMYLSATAADIEYFKQFESHEEIIEVIPRTEVEKREFNVKSLSEDNCRIINDIEKNMNKINDVEKKILKNKEFIEECEKNIALLKDEINNLHNEYDTSVKENTNLNCELDALINKKSEVNSNIEIEQKKIESIVPVVEKMNQFCNDLEEEIIEKEKEHEKILSKAEELNAKGLDLSKKFLEKLELNSEHLSSSKQSAEDIKEKVISALDITALETLQKAASKDYFDFSSLEKEAKKDFANICSLAENEFGILKDKVNSKEIEVSKKLEEIPTKFNTKIQERKKTTINDVVDYLSRDLNSLKSELEVNTKSEDTTNLRSIFKNVF